MSTEHGSPAIRWPRRRAALALAAIGTPLVAAAPASADGNAGAPPGVPANASASVEGQTQSQGQSAADGSPGAETAPQAQASASAQTEAQASTQASASAGTGAQASAPAYAGAPAAPAGADSTTTAAQNSDQDARDDSGASETAQSSVQTTATENSGDQANRSGRASGNANQSGARATAAPGRDGRGDDAGANAQSGPDRGGRARTRGRVHAGAQVSPQAHVRGGRSATRDDEIEDRGNAAASTRAGGDREASAAHAGSASEHRPDGLTHVSVRTHEDEHGPRRATATVKVGAGLRAALDNEARAAAREALRAELDARGFEREHAAGAAAAAQQAHVVHVLRAALQTGGPAQVAAVVEALFGHEVAGRPVSPEVAAFLASIEHGTVATRAETGHEHGGNERAGARHEHGDDDNAEARHEHGADHNAEVRHEHGADHNAEARHEVRGNDRGEAESEGALGVENEGEGEVRVEALTRGPGAAEAGVTAGVASPTAPAVPASTTSIAPTPVTTSTPPSTQQAAPAVGSLPEASNGSSPPSGGRLPQESNGSASPTGGGRTVPTAFAGTQRVTQQDSGEQSGQLPLTGGDVPLVLMLGGAALAAGALLMRRGRSGAR